MQTKFMNQSEQSIGIFTTDVNLKIRSWDSWLTAVTGLSLETVRGTSLLEIFPDLEHRGFRTYFQQVLTIGNIEKLLPPIYSYLIPCVPRTHSKRFEYMQQRVTIAPLREHETIVGMIVTIEDLTPQLEWERELSELSEQLKSGEVSQRLRAVQSLATQTEEWKDTEQLLEALGDENWRVRQVAVNSLAQKRNVDAVAILVGKIRNQHQDISVLNSALKVLAQLKGDIIGPLTELLQLPDEDLRGYVVLALGEQSDRRAIPALMDMLNDSNQNVRYNAIEALGKLRAIEAVDVLANITESGDFFLAFPALDALKKIGDPSVLPRIIRLLEDELLQEPAIEVLGQLGDTTVAVSLAQLLNTQSTLTLTLAKAIATLYHRYEELFNEGEQIVHLVQPVITEQGLRHLLAALNYPKEEELHALTLILGWLTGEAVEQALTQLLGKATVQTEVVRALVRQGPRIVQLLIEQLALDDLEIRLATITALERLGDKRAVPALTQILLTADNPKLIIGIANALTRIGDPQAFEVLLDFLGHPNTAVRQATIAALNALNPPAMAPRVITLLQDDNPYLRESAVKIIGYIGGYPNGLELLLTACQDANEKVRQAAIESLPYVDSEAQILSTLVTALQTDVPKIRAAAARALADIDGEQAVTYLCQALQDPEAWVRYFAARALSQHHNAPCGHQLIQLAQYDEAEQVCIAAVETLGALGEVQAIALLKRLTQLASEELAIAALSALGKIHHPAALSPLIIALHSLAPARYMEAISAVAQHRNLEAVTALQEIALLEGDLLRTEAAIAALKQIATPEAISAIITVAAHPSKRSVCIKALSQLDESQIEWLARGLTHEQIAIRAATVETLVRLNHPQAFQHLLAALSDPEASVRLAVVVALGRVKEPGVATSAVSKLAAEDVNLAVQRAAKNFLKQAVTTENEGRL